VLTKGGFYRGGPVLSSAVAGIDQALWDIAGKAHGVPVHELLGGPVRDRVRMYGWIGGDKPANVTEAAARQVAAGFTAVKMNASAALAPIDTPARTKEIVERVAAVRQVIGDGRDVAVDFDGRLSMAMARRVLPLLEPYQPLFVEEPVVPEYSRDLRSLVTCSTVPLATGERLFPRWDFRDVLPTGIAVAQPDLSHAGGISETRRIAARKRQGWASTSMSARSAAPARSATRGAIRCGPSRTVRSPSGERSGKGHIRAQIHQRARGQHPAEQAEGPCWDPRSGRLVWVDQFGDLVPFSA
jgi:galactonate dehydratase